MAKLSCFQFCDKCLVFYTVPSRLGHATPDRVTINRYSPFLIILSYRWSTMETKFFALVAGFCMVMLFRSSDALSCYVCGDCDSPTDSFPCAKSFGVTCAKSRHGVRWYVYNNYAYQVVMISILEPVCDSIVLVLLYERLQPVIEWEQLCSGSVVVTAYDLESGRPVSNPEWAIYYIKGFNYLLTRDFIPPR